VRKEESAEQARRRLESHGRDEPLMEKATTFTPRGSVCEVVQACLTNMLTCIRHAGTSSDCNWSSKAIAAQQTLDYRANSLEDLGRYTVLCTQL
jgi:hypothetical protein